MPRRLKARLCHALAKTGLDAWFGALLGARQRPWVLGYHTVVDDDAQLGELMPGLGITAATFERHVDWMARRFQLVALDELVSLGARTPGPEKPLAAITFDDGYRGVFEVAFPILRRKGIPASLFVVTDRVGSTEPLAHDRIYHLLSKRRSPEETHAATRELLHLLGPAEIERLAEQLCEPAPADSLELPVTWPMVHELREAGWTIGSHTRTHARLVSCTGAELLDETALAKQILEAELRQPVHHFAYPDGAFDPRAVDAVSAAGYSSAYTTCAHRDARHPGLTVPRTMLWEGSSIEPSGGFSPDILSVQSSGLLELLAGCRDTHRALADRDPPVRAVA